jgi:hypothetical protein
MVQQDIMRLSRVVRRVQCDPKRSAEEKQELLSALNRCIALLAGPRESAKVVPSRRRRAG